MCIKNISQPFKFFCYTEDKQGIGEEINIIPFVDYGLEIITHNKLFLFSSYIDYYLCEGPRVFFDLDLLIRKNIDHIVNDNKGELTLIRSTWREEYERGFPIFHHMFNSSCMTWKAPHTRKIWEHFIRDPEHFTCRYHWGMDAFLSYEKENIDANIHFFPEREFVSFLGGGVDFFEQKYYEKRYKRNHISIRPEVIENASVMLLNNDSTQLHYKHYQKFYVD